MRTLLKHRFVRFFGISLLGTLLVVCFGMGSSILTARLLGPEGKGAYTLLYSTIVFSISLFGLKLDFSQAYLRQHYKFSSIAKATVSISLINGLAAMLLSYAVVLLIYDRIYKSIPMELAVYVVSLVPVLLMAQNLRAAINADYDIPKSTLVQTSRPAFFFTIFAVLSLAGLATLETAVYAIGFSIYGMLLLALLITRNKMERTAVVTESLVGSIVKFAIKTHVGQLFKYMQYRFDVFLIALFLDVSDVGVYSVAVVIAEILWHIPNVASSVLLPRIATEGGRRSAQVSARLNRIIFSFTILCILPMTLWSEWLIQLLFGDEYAGAGEVVLFLLPGILALTVFKLLTPNLIMHGRAWTFSFSVFVSVIVMVLLDILLVPTMGIVGAGLASSCAYLVAALIVLVSVYRINDLPLSAYFDISCDWRAYRKVRGAK